MEPEEAKTGSRSLEWISAFTFAKSFGADLFKFFVVFGGLTLVGFCVHLVKIAGFMDPLYVDAIEKLDFVGDFVLILQLVIDLNVRYFSSLKNRKQ